MHPYLCFRAYRIYHYCKLGRGDANRYGIYTVGNLGSWGLGRGNLNSQLQQEIERCRPAQCTGEQGLLRVACGHCSSCLPNSHLLHTYAAVPFGACRALKTPIIPFRAVCSFLNPAV
jgi:hypothetical protein